MLRKRTASDRTGRREPPNSFDVKITLVRRTLSSRRCREYHEASKADPDPAEPPAYAAAEVVTVEPDPYALLGTRRGLSDAAYDEAYIARADACQPSVDASPAAAAKFRQLAAAYEMVKDAAARERTDAAPVTMLDGTVVPLPALGDALAEAADAPADVVAVPLAVGQAALVTRAGTWVNALAFVKATNADGTYDVAVLSKYGRLKEDYVLTNKPYPDEVRPAPPAVAARLDAMRSSPPGFFDKYTVRVVREKHGREEWGTVTINPYNGWLEATTRRRYPETLWDRLLEPRYGYVERVHGADERNTGKLLREIQSATRWRNADQVYCGGAKLESSHLFRVNGAACNGRPLVVLSEGETYDRERWRGVAEKRKPVTRQGRSCGCSIQ